jgi:hypothetical protein
MNAANPVVPDDESSREVKRARFHFARWLAACLVITALLTAGSLVVGNSSISM